MNRRSFLASLAAALTLDPERALYVPGKKLISVPPPKVLRVRIQMHFIGRDGLRYEPEKLAFHRNAYIWAYGDPTSARIIE